MPFETMPFETPRLSRRSFLHGSTLISAALAARMVTEPMLAKAALPGPLPNDAIKIDANENPLGPSQAARSAIADVIPQGGRYHMELTDNFAQLVAEQNGLPVDHIAVYAGSTVPLHHAVLAFTSPKRSYVTADPGYEAGMEAAKVSGARVIKVPLTRTYAHDIPAMLRAAPDAGLFYICTPNNPTGTLTPHADIEYAVQHQPKGSVVLIDEAYIHFCEAPTAVDLVKAGHDIVVLRTFSKIYGMAGLRCGLAIARPDLLSRIHTSAGWNAMPVTALAAAMASLKDPQLVPERRHINKATRQATFQWLDRQGYHYIPSESNFFLLDTGRPGRQVIDAMLAQRVAIGRIWPLMPTYVRITVGTSDEMLAFQSAYKRVMDGAVTASVSKPGRNRNFDGFRA